MTQLKDPLDYVVSFLKETGELATASALLQKFKQYSTELHQYDQLGRLFHDVKDYRESLECTERCLALASSPQQLYAVRSNLAKLYNHTNQPHKALVYIEANLNINPDDYEAKMEKVFSLYLASDLIASKALTEELLTDPKTPPNVRHRCEFNYGSYLLDDGRFQEGMVKFIDTGHKIGIWKSINFKNAWRGDITSDKIIAIQAEGGIGDEVINVRFLKNLKDRGMNPIFVTNRDELVSLFNRHGFHTVRSSSEVPENAEWIHAMYLPILLDVQKNELWNGPYLTPDPSYVEKWKQILPQGKKIAIRWSGNPLYEQDLHRSIPLDKLDEALNFSRADATIISIQKDNNEALGNYSCVFDAAPYLETLEDLLACISLMDYTVSSCTSVAHITAAAGFPLTVCPPVATYYTWLGDAKWYGDNCTILRQRRWQDWDHLKLIKV